MNIADIVRRQTKRLEFAQLVEEFRRSDPVFLDELGFGSNGSRVRTARRRGGRKEPGENAAFEVVTRVLQARQNLWTDLSMLRDEGKLTKAQLSYAVKVNADKLDRRKNPKHAKKIQVRLKQAA